MLGPLFKQAAELQGFLNELKIPHAFIGGIANSIHGEPRATLDADVLILVAHQDIEDLLRQLETHARLLMPKAASFARRSSVIPCAFPSGLRADLVLADLEFEKNLIKRARSRPVARGLRLRICKAEDLVIMKMVSTRPKDRGDVEGIVRRQRSKLDAAYIMKWLKNFEKALDWSDLAREFKRIHLASKI
ncbi:MAG TPA: DUF6036 family nucleotidyltransferase [bacterium]|jgi:hypothetical protein